MSKGGGSSALAVRQYGGSLQAVQSVQGAEQVRRQVANREAWPYEHLFPPPDSIPVHQIGSVAVPTAVSMGGSAAVVLAYTVPSGYKFILHAILQAWGPGVFNPGDLVWTVDVNTPLGIPNVQATYVQGLAFIPIPLGSWQYGTLWPLVRPYEFDALDLIQSKVTNINLSAGPPNCVSGFFGYLLPVLGGR